MKYSLIPIVVIGCILFAGCQRNSIETDQFCSFRNEFNKHRELIQNDSANTISFAREIANKLKSLPNEELRMKCIKEWTAILLELDLLQISAKGRPGHAYRCWSSMRDLFENTLRYEMSSFEDRWNLQLQFLSWCRSEILKMSLLPFYPKGVSRIVNSYGFERWRVDPLSHIEFSEYRTKLDWYNFFSEEYEIHLNNRETLFHRYCAREHDEDVKVVTSMFENFLGRRIRSEVECLEDFEVKRRVEFPMLIPTTYGLQKRWKAQSGRHRR